mgnify:CR=1 FL=1
MIQNFNFNVFKIFGIIFSRKRLSFFTRYRKNPNQELPLEIKGLQSGLAVHFAECCLPLPNENIIGVSEIDVGIIIHNSNCKKLNEDFSENSWLSATWKDISSNIPASPVNVIREDPVNADILYLGTDAGVYISTNGGKDFYPLSNLPPVAVHDLAIQEENRDLIVATHGRSLYKIQLEPVYQSETFRDSLFKLLELPQIKYSESWGKLNYRWETRVPSLSIVFFSELNEPVDIEIRDSEDRVLLTKSISSVKGYNRNDVKLEFQENPSDNLLQGALHKYYLSPGMYTVHLKQNTLLRTQTFLVK